MTSNPSQPWDAGEETLVPLGRDFADLRDSVRSICQKFPASYWRGLEDRKAYPEAFVEEFTKSGYTAALIPEEYGGSGLSLRAASVIVEEINSTGCCAASFHGQMYIMGTLLRHGSAEQKQKYLPRIATGELRLQAFAVSEPTTGTDTTQLKTRATRKGDKYIVNGQKVWISRALHSDLMLLLARTKPLDQVSKKTDGISVFLVDVDEAKRNGMDVRPLDAMINHQTNEIFFNDVPIPAENLVGEENKGFQYILDGMNAERVLVAAEAVGDARFFIDKASAYAKERIVFNRPIGQNQGVQFPIARAYAEMRAADAMVRNAAALFDHGRPCGEEANIAKLLASEACWRAAEAALQTHGGFGYAREYDVERKWREARLFQIAPISTNLILSYLGQHVLGMPRSF
ncbi:acyl-CoA dehydrogenase family protein [Bosea sp. (in: a-proteobacteria)]|uniref:acyl-CoA dehydrogenase family protein n=1 Tax=Bosea sp. (in: a-proteobacteria) TaxID=1871050 RepID=UPI00261A53A3|nr:acyl-CoA dehydrogenase family protein [Bosea sp. (in: a-proteobacteria)]MCO5090211.1 acyl-CoA/acyl-ACP dehydrogenase [Bosea sp. (in: a-proteobacteria)]